MREPPVHRTSIQVRFSELDPYGHVNHAVYLSYFEVARIELLDEVGFGLERLRGLGFHVVVVEASVRYHRPAVWGDRLAIETRVDELRRATSRWHQRMLRGDDLVAELTVRAACTAHDGRPVAAPADLVGALRAFGDGAGG